MRLKKVEPQVTISLCQLYHVWFIPASFLNFPKKVLLFFFPLSISAERIHWASYSDLLGFDSNLYTIKTTVKDFFWPKPIDETGNRGSRKAGKGIGPV